MLHVFHLDVAKVDRDVAHVAMAIHVRCKCMFQIFSLFQTYVASVLFGYCKSRSGCCIYMQMFGVFICMLQVFHLYVCNGYKHVFKFFLVFCKCFRRMLQVFHLFLMYVASVSSGCCKNRSGVAYVAMGPTCGGCNC